MNRLDRTKGYLSTTNEAPDTKGSLWRWQLKYAHTGLRAWLKPDPLRKGHLLAEIYRTGSDA